MALTPDQLAWRQGRITSSRIASIRDRNPYQSMFAAWLDITGRTPPKPANEAMECGHDYEHKTLERGGRLFGWVPEPAEPRSVAPWIGDHTDCVYIDPSTGELKAVGEAKTVGMGNSDGFGEQLTDEVPDYVLDQSHCHLIHWPEVDRCIVPVLSAGYEGLRTRVYVVERDVEYAGILLEDAERFHRDYIATDKPPPFGEKDEAYLRGEYPRAGEPETEVEATPEIESMALEYIRLRDVATAAEKARKAYKVAIYDHMGLHGVCKGPTWSITWRNNDESEWTDWEGMARDAGIVTPTLEAHYKRLKLGPRVLRVTAIKPKAEKKRKAK